MNLKRKHSRKNLLVILENGKKGVFKIARRRVFSAGKDGFSQIIQSSLTAYRFSRFMGFDFVPPIVQREIDGKRGALQLFIEGESGRRYDAKKRLDAKTKSDIYIFYFVAGEHDAAERHLIFGERCKKPAVIDIDQLFALSVFFYGKYPFRPFSVKGHFIPPKSSEQWRAFPLNKMKSIDFSGITGLADKISRLKKEFTELNDARYYYWLAGYYISSDNKLHYVPWRGAYYVQLPRRYVYIDFTPAVFRKKTVKRLRESPAPIFEPFFRRCPDLKRFFPSFVRRWSGPQGVFKAFRNLLPIRFEISDFPPPAAGRESRQVETGIKQDHNKKTCDILESYVSGFLFRRNLILKEAEKTLPPSSGPFK